ncbi:hypothetical protein M404DRAFT_998537 [Pisolithus tinctorius Marx 270]|uniref:Uncharacterized protein n=1 Tax=Pisolithus tinctorius Marx 270 TaxID=870435 RepID=A0A0C3JDF7_PISTI|nr:hypothetical protein M404DRAFT_998537 [Pisolithus tinctorius Marx 270]
MWNSEANNEMEKLFWLILIAEELCKARTSVFTGIKISASVIRRRGHRRALYQADRTRA